MTNKTEMFTLSRELLERAINRPTLESLPANAAGMIDRGRAQAEIREMLAKSEGRAVTDPAARIAGDIPDEDV